jgi:hypothetical protein
MALVNLNQRIAKNLVCTTFFWEKRIGKKRTWYKSAFWNNKVISESLIWFLKQVWSHNYLWDCFYQATWHTDIVYSTTYNTTQNSLFKEMVWQTGEYDYYKNRKTFQYLVQPQDYMNSKMIHEMWDLDYRYDFEVNLLLLSWYTVEYMKLNKNKIFNYMLKLWHSSTTSGQSFLKNDELKNLPLHLNDWIIWEPPIQNDYDTSCEIFETQ